MAEKKYTLSIYEIDEEQDLKFVNLLKTNFVPNIGHTIEWLIEDENGIFSRRIQYVVKNVVYPCFTADNNIISHIDSDEIALQVKLEVDEPIL